MNRHKNSEFEYADQSGHFVGTSRTPVAWSTSLTYLVCSWMLLAPFVVQAQPSVPTSGRIAFHNYTAWDINSGDPNGPNSLDGQIHLYDFTSDSVSTIGVIDRFVRHALNPNFSPDGTKITFAGIPRGPDYGADWFNFLDTYEYDFTKGTLTNISTAAKLGSSVDEDAVYGPGGASIIYKKNFQTLWSIDLTTFQETQLFPSALETPEPKVSPSGQWITYWQQSAGNASTGDVYRRPILPDGTVGAAIPVATTPGVLEYFSSFLDDQTIVYSRWTDAATLDDEIYLVDLATGLSRSAAFNQTGTGDDSDAFRLEDTNTVGFSSIRTGGKGGYDLYIGDSTTGDVHYLPVASTPKEDLAGSYHAQLFQVQPGLSLFTETFDTEVADATAFNNQYGGPLFGILLDNTAISVAGGMLQLTTTSGFGEADVFTTPYFSPDAGIDIAVEIGAAASNGDFNVGITLGGTPIVFHPGFGATPGAFRVGNGPNQDMGFTPANGVLHPWSIVVSDAGEVIITITDGLDSNNIFSTSFVDPLLADGFKVGLYREGGAGTSPFQALYDNLLISTSSVDLNADFDLDTDIDGDDFLTWQRGFGTIVGALLGNGDANEDSKVNGEDLTVWQNQFGTSSVTLSSVSTLPEPSTATLLAILVSCLLGAAGRHGCSVCGPV